MKNLLKGSPSILSREYFAPSEGVSNARHSTNETRNDDCWPLAPTLLHTLFIF
jgi:hypothetical protein